MTAADTARGTRSRRTDRGAGGRRLLPYAVALLASACFGGDNAARDADLPRLNGLVLYPRPIVEAPPHLQSILASATSRAEKRAPTPPVHWSSDLDEQAQERWQQWMDGTFLPWWVSLYPKNPAVDRFHEERRHLPEDELFMTLQVLTLQEHDLATLQSIGVSPPTAGSCEPNLGREYAAILRGALSNTDRCLRQLQSLGAPLRDNEPECRRRNATFRQSLENIDLTACPSPAGAD